MSILPTIKEGQRWQKKRRRKNNEMSSNCLKGPTHGERKKQKKIYYYFFPLFSLFKTRAIWTETLLLLLLVVQFALPSIVQSPLNDTVLCRRCDSLRSSLFSVSMSETRNKRSFCFVFFEYCDYPFYKEKEMHADK